MYNVLEQAEAVFRGMTIDVPAGQKLYAVMPGDYVRVKATLSYRGPKWENDTFYVAIGEWRGITWPTDIGNFDEIWHEEFYPVNFAASADFLPYQLTVDVPIKQIGLAPWTPGWFDVYAKLKRPGLTGLFAPRLDNVIEVLLAPEFQNFTIVSYDRIPGA